MQPVNPNVNDLNLYLDQCKFAFQEEAREVSRVPNEQEKKRFKVEKKDKDKKKNKPKKDSPWIPKHLQDEDDEEE